MSFTILICLLPLLAVAERPCNNAHEEYIFAMNASPSGMLLGAEEPRCNENGEYRDRICSGTDCWCVKPNGEEISQYHHRRWEVDSSAMDCKCARKEAAFTETGMVGLTFRCTKEGNYESVQCTGSMCFCADSNGEQVGDAVHIVEMNTLNCS